MLPKMVLKRIRQIIIFKPTFFAFQTYFVTKILPKFIWLWNFFLLIIEICETLVSFWRMIVIRQNKFLNLYKSFNQSQSQSQYWEICRRSQFFHTIRSYGRAIEGSYVDDLFKKGKLLERLRGLSLVFWLWPLCLRWIMGQFSLFTVFQ